MRKIIIAVFRGGHWTIGSSVLPRYHQKHSVVGGLNGHHRPLTVSGNLPMCFFVSIRFTNASITIMPRRRSINSSPFDEKKLQNGTGKLFLG